MLACAQREALRLQARTLGLEVLGRYLQADVVQHPGAFGAGRSGAGHQHDLLWNATSGRADAQKRG